jgi:hypothetical protein
MNVQRVVTISDYDTSVLAALRAECRETGRRAAFTRRVALRMGCKVLLPGATTAVRAALQRLAAAGLARREESRCSKNRVCWELVP